MDGRPATLTDSILILINVFRMTCSICYIIMVNRDIFFFRGRKEKKTCLLFFILWICVSELKRFPRTVRTHGLWQNCTVNMKFSIRSAACSRIATLILNCIVAIGVRFILFYFFFAWMISQNLINRNAHRIFSRYTQKKSLNTHLKKN